jgi:Alpha galactosidase A/Alpha galactosidase C-terminal beta sandwich domain
MQFISRLKKILLIIGYLMIAESGFSQSHKTPLMGWASWNNFDVNISESIINTQADAMKSSGLSEAGYNFINIDDGYFNGRYSNGKLRIDSIKFPNGMKAVADHIHFLGLKAGIYSEAGANTCGSIFKHQVGGNGVGLYGHDQQDINLFFKDWGYDYIKVDYCGGLILGLDERARYTAVRNAIDNTGIKDLHFNVCRWQFPGTWVTKMADSWRISDDIMATWKSVMFNFDKNAYLAAYASPGHYNDMDMLEVGRGLTAEEDKSHFSLWCIMSSPLVLGNDLTTLSEQTKTVLTNKEAIAVNQDTTGLQARLISSKNGCQVWAKHLNGKISKEWAVVLFNRTKDSAEVSVKWREIDLLGEVKVRDLWRHKDLGKMRNGYSVKLPSHGVVMLKVEGERSMLQEDFEAEYAWVNNFNLTQNGAIVGYQGKPVEDILSSGGAKVSWLGNKADNFIEFRDVYADHTGLFLMTVSYFNGVKRKATVTINDRESFELNFGKLKLTTKPKVTTIIRLNKGFNTIRFSNAMDWMPDFDKIHINFNNYLRF